MKFFSNEWAQQLKNTINANQEYKNSSEGWKSSLILSMKNNGEEQFLFLDLDNGECKEIQIAAQDKLETADFIINAGKETWRRILSGSLSPMQALMMKSLKIDKGNMSDLLPYINSLKELLNSAMKIETDFD
ncbi:MAG: SCP2 sterol-binding domain-containing protein [Bacteroidota bacterium]|jgi:putative sterol carrier protein